MKVIMNMLNNISSRSPYSFKTEKERERGLYGCASSISFSVMADKSRHQDGCNL
jgi:hypothetical protein